MKKISHKTIFTLLGLLLLLFLLVFGLGLFKSEYGFRDAEVQHVTEEGVTSQPSLESVE